MSTINTKRIAVVTAVILIPLICLGVYAFKKQPKDGGFKITPSNIQEVLTVDGEPTNVLATVNIDELNDVTQTSTRFYVRTEENQKALIDFLASPEEYSLFYDSMYTYKVDDKEYIVLKAKYNYQEVAEALQSKQLVDRNHFNSFIKSCEYRNSTVDDANPITVINESCGNCNAFTMLTYVYLDKYEPNTEKELIPVFSEEEGYAHIYLKVKESTSSDAYTVDCTKSLYLK